MLGVLLPEDSTQPILVNIQTMKKGSMVVVNEKQFIGNVESSRNWMPYNPLKGNKQLDDTLMFYFRDNFFNDGSKENVCIKKLTNGKCPHGWRGPMLVTKQKGDIFKERNSSPKDVTAQDFGNIIDYLLFYGSNRS